VSQSSKPETETVDRISEETDKIYVAEHFRERNILEVPSFGKVTPGNLYLEPVEVADRYEKNSCSM
jgi:hypothetical protein